MILNVRIAVDSNLEYVQVLTGGIIDMNTFKLEPVDILVNVNDRNDPYSVAKRWCVGPYDHVFLYLGQMAILTDSVVLRHPMLFESNGRGVVLQSLSNRFTQKVVVMRLKSEYDRRRIPCILEEAIKLASDEKAYYDYYCLPLHIIPRILHEKFGMPIPVKYHRDERQVCSEAVNEVFIRGRLVDILPAGIVPLPGDFVSDSPLLEEVWRGSLSASEVF